MGDSAEDSNHIETTISEDLADGRSEKLDAGLRLLCDNELRLRIPSDNLADTEIHVTGT